MKEIIAAKIISETEEIFKSEWVLGIFSNKEVWTLIGDRKILVFDCSREEVAKEIAAAHNQKLSLPNKLRKIYKLIDGSELILTVY